MEKIHGVTTMIRNGYRDSDDDNDDDGEDEDEYDDLDDDCDDGDDDGDGDDGEYGDGGEHYACDDDETGVTFLLSCSRETALPNHNAPPDLFVNLRMHITMPFQPGSKSRANADDGEASERETQMDARTRT